MYTHTNFKTKKALKEAVEAWNQYDSSPLQWRMENGHMPSQLGAVMSSRSTPRPVTYYQPGPFGGVEPRDGTIYVEGPHYPEPHKWYAQCEAKDGKIIKVHK
jgi:hypothetical protein